MDPFTQQLKKWKKRQKELDKILHNNRDRELDLRKRNALYLQRIQKTNRHQQVQALRHVNEEEQPSSSSHLPSPHSPPGKPKPISQYYKVRLDSTRHSRKFKAQENKYNINFEEFPEEENKGFVRRLFRDMLKTVKYEMQCNPNDYLRLNIRHPSLKSEIWYEFTQCKHLNEEVILNKIEAVQQSKKDFKLGDGSMEFDMFHVKYPEGSGGNNTKHLMINKDTFLKGKKSIVQIDNPWDKMCLARAIVITRLHSEKPENPDLEWEKRWKRMRIGDVRSNDQENQAKALMEQAGCDIHQSCGPEEWGKLQQVLYPQYRLKIFQIKSMSSKFSLEPIYKGNGQGISLNILLEDHHYHAILSMPGITGCQYYCDHCDVGYRNITDHRSKCPFRCDFCLSYPPCPKDGSQISCPHCQGFFKNRGCYENHLRPYSKNTTTTICNLMGRCDQCQKWMPKKLLSHHLCGGRKQCKICKKIVQNDHQCYVQQKPPKKKKGKETLQIYIYFDFECTQENGIHIPNLCVAHRVCQHCGHLPIEDPCPHCRHMGPRQHVFQGLNTLKDFMDWLLQPISKGNKNGTLLHDEAIIIAHNFKGYDGQFILNYLVHSACIKPTVIQNGSKILSMEILGLKFIDSYNFLPFALSKMPSAFGFTELKKGYFPHFFNTVQNQNYVGPYPPASFYNPDDMTINGRQAFFQWYDQQAGKVFDFQKEFLEYCISDVDILRRCCAQFRATLKNLVNVDPFQESITFASAANLAYRRGFMPEDTIAIIPNLGYQPARQYSAKACRWLTFLSQQSGSHIQHARNGGEVKIGSYTVDGYQEDNHTIYEFYGCYWHGCPTCFSNLQTETHPHQPQWTYQQLYEETLRRKSVLEQFGYSVTSIWEHEFDQQVQRDEVLQNFLSDLNISDPLNPREALYGGRTNATRLYCEEGEMRYIDVCSLYPYVLKHRPFPVGHPQIITDQFQDVRSYFGLIHCRVLPPRGLYHPVLPYRTGGKLLFSLCRTCAKQQDPKHRCRHNSRERSLTGTWVTTELHKALDMGYTLEKIYEVWHFPESSTDLFRPYIDTFLKIKQEASGFPPECQTEEQQLNYIRQVLEKEGIRMDWLSIEKNPVRRTIAKLFLNCLWGKFAQRLLLPKTKYLTEEEELHQLLQDSRIEIKGIQLLENKENPELDMMLVNYQDKNQFVEECPFGNIILACFTTAHARLHLYETLQPLGDRVLYFDTDSIIYQHKEGQFNPILGNSLGEWTDELDGDHIIKFMSGGPKNYAYLTSKGNSILKVKGLTLNYRASNIVSLETLEKMLKKEIDEVTVSYPYKIQRTRDHQVKTVPLEKQYRIVYDKRQILKDYNTLPYGY
ncbi:uncharacterized protein LOC133180197 [Saccostrea echinata]|uniref:uncharacterized protein LOC133180197 n=1 Tax=Saccostrea echinata TaxID=191078 RepID=UPI002A83D9F5|nr:uncharacterized protein LOC133180197 [Saccostrea echinata]